MLLARRDSQTRCGRKSVEPAKQFADGRDVAGVIAGRQQDGFGEAPHPLLDRHLSWRGFLLQPASLLVSLEHGVSLDWSVVGGDRPRCGAPGEESRCPALCPWLAPCDPLADLPRITRLAGQPNTLGVRPPRSRRAWRGSDPTARRNRASCA